MGLAQLPIWRAGIFRNLKSMVSSPTRSQQIVRISEMSVVSRETLPMATGFMTDPERKWSWMVVHPLKIWLEDEPEQVQLISERSYFPLDPFGFITEDMKSKLHTLTQIAKMRHAEKRSQVIHENKHDAHTSLLGKIATSCFVIDAICLVIYFLQNRGGG